MNKYLNFKNGKSMELSENDINDTFERLDLEQGLLRENEIIENVFDSMIKTRTILINDQISESTIEKVVMPLIKMDNDGSGKKITIYLNTVGGSVYNGLALCNIIERLKTPTDIIVLGYAYSMGSLILMAGANNKNVTRYCYPFSTALIHGGSDCLSGTTSQVKDYFKFTERFENRITEYIISHTKFTDEEYKTIERYECYMDSDEMLSKGLVDKIL